MTRTLTDRLRHRTPLVLDGAMGTELRRRGVHLGLPLWSANALITAPEQVLGIHRDYLAAGADIITTNTFRTTCRACRRAGLPDRSDELTATAMLLARQARDEVTGRHPLIAGSIAPLEDCYRPDLVPPDRELVTEHTQLARRLAREGADILLLETMISIREAVAATRAARETGLETVVSFTCRSDGALYGGEALESAVEAVLPLGPAALSLNCISPRLLGPLLALLRTLTNLPVAVYGNVGRPGGEQRAEDFVVDVGAAAYAEYAGGWIDNGASIVGGCCGTTPEYIRLLRGRTPQKHRGTE